jgi:Skp family chaperone for outer membrane proteins
MAELEAVGEAATGAMIGRAVEPQAGEAADGHTHETACLNCAAPLTGSYCQACGQRAHVHRTLSAFWHDLAHGVLHLDGKLWRTLPLLAWHPGQLTRRYVDGERAKFVSPMALFLFSVFLMFAVFSLIGAPAVTGDAGLEATAEERAEAQREFDQERAESAGELRELQARRAELVAAGQPTAAVDADIRRTRSQMALEERLFRQTMDLISAEDARDAQAAEAEERAKVAGPARTTAEQADKGEAVLIGGADSLNAWFNKAWRKAKENPSLLIYKVQNNAYKFSWLLIPISIPFVWLLFLHRRRYRQAFTAYDHTVFVTYSIAFMSLGAIALGVLDALGMSGGWSLLLIAVVPPVHIYRQLKGAYGLSRFSALWRTITLLVLSLVALSLFASILLLLGVLG